MILSIFFFFQTVIGVTGNFFLISLFIIMFLSRHRLRPIDTILTQLALTNCLALLSKGVPKTMVALGMKNFLDNTGCKITLYLQRVARCLSVTLTCLLSGFQAITISPSNSRSAGLKARTPKYIIPTSLLCWTFQLLQNVFIPIGIIDPKHTRNVTERQNYGYCSHLVPSGFRAFLYAFILSFPDAVFLGFMVFASGYMVFLLYRHHKHIEKIHIACISARVSLETRATKTILLLVTIFVSSYSLDCILAAYMSFMKSSPRLVHTSVFMTSFFPSISPYVLISSDSQVPKYCYTLLGRKCSNFNSNSK
ncbi:vomeronasal type-1 receptor 1-like [Trichosurus vulpecula]|uniref:vomeronasal type-1 receptor 1-like n=1 Tax=Trichosurus vulpecula TaxID=9337 RepID=UPI00186AC21E|nr:vomeronasal type-1 receptor 1-like [Trichosurus vulpecula]